MALSDSTDAGKAVVGGGFGEGVDHDGPGDAPVRGDGEGVAGMVVEPGDDLGIGAGGEAGVGEVCLPHLVGQIGFEPDVGRLGPFFGVGPDEAGGGQAPPDRRGRHGDAVSVLEVPGDGVGAGVESPGVEVGAQVNDQLVHLRCDGGRRGARPARAGLERGVALSAVSGHQLGDLRAGQAVGSGHFGVGSPLDDDSGG